MIPLRQERLWLLSLTAVIAESAKRFWYRFWGFFSQLSYFIKNTSIILKTGILYYNSYYSKIDGSLSGGCIVMTLKLFVNIAQSFLSIFQQGDISAKYNLSHMIYAVCFKDNHAGKQTQEKRSCECVSLSSKSIFSVCGFGWLLCDHETHSGGQEAICASLSVPGSKQPAPWLRRFLLVLQLTLPSSYVSYWSKIRWLQDWSHTTSVLSLPSHPRYEKNALFYGNITFGDGFV